MENSDHMRFVYKSRDHFIEEKIKNKKVLSLGAADMDGKGRQFFWMKKIASKVYGADYMKSFCQAHDDVCFCDFNQDFSIEGTFELPSGSNIDVIVMIEVLEHLNNPLFTLGVIKKKWPGKKLFFSVPNGCSLGKIIRSLFNDKIYPNDDYDHIGMFNFRTLRNIIERNNINQYCINVFEEHTFLRPFVRGFKHFGQSFCVELTL